MYTVSHLYLKLCSHLCDLQLKQAIIQDVSKPILLFEIRDYSTFLYYFETRLVSSYCIYLLA